MIANIARPILTWLMIIFLATPPNLFGQQAGLSWGDGVLNYPIGADAADDEGRLLAEPRWHLGHHGAGHAVHCAVAGGEASMKRAQDGGPGEQ